MKIIAVIPARYASTRFPGKPLVDICGKPMLWWVYQEAMRVQEYDDVIVATDSNIIIDACNELGMNSMMTSDKHPMGTDRVAEVASKTGADYYMIILGDEPILKAEDQKKVVRAINSGVDADLFQLVETMSDPVDVVNTTTIKLAINDEGYCVFLSRAPIPTPRAALGYTYYKNTGCFAMKRETLEFFVKTKRGNIELAEDIEQLRLIENHRKIFTVQADFLSMSVDTPKDLERIQKIIEQQIRETK
jgi:3-deoxy-manno-octulosonate cytidylyltransferase (CMP-KDO synthetase)